MQLHIHTSLRRKLLCLLSLSYLAAGIVVLYGCDPLNGIIPAPTSTPANASTPTPASTPTLIIEPTPNSNGAMDRANLHGTGVYVTKGVVQLHGLKWKHKMSSQPGGFGLSINGKVGSTPAIIDGTIYIGGAEDYLFALDAETGQEKWRFKTPGGSVNSPAVADGIVYFGSGDENLYAVDTKTGKEIWRFALPKLPEENSPWSSSRFSNPAVAGGIVYVGNERNVSFALDSKTGQVRWSRQVSASVEYTPAVVDGVVYFGTSTGSNIQARQTSFYALDAQTGRERWQTAQPSDVAGSPAVADGFLYVAFSQSGLFAFDATTGQRKWQFRGAGGVDMFSPAVANSTVYINSVVDDRLYAVDGQTGQEKWRFHKDEGFFIDPVIAEGMVYCLTFLSPTSSGQSTSGSLHAINAQTGQEQWRFFAPGSIGNVAAVADGVIYFLADDEYLYAIH